MRFWYLIGLLSVMLGCTAQKIVSDEVVIVSAKMDSFRNVYTLHSDNSILSYGDDLGVKHRFNKNMSGITCFDVYNPQKILVYSYAQGTIHVLDNTLSEIHNIVIDEDRYLDIPVVAMSNDNNIWLWDAGSVALIKINEYGEEVFRSEFITLTDFGDVLEMQEAGNHLYIRNNNTMFVMSNLGILEHKIPLKDVSAISYNENGFCYLHDGLVIERKLPFYEKSSTMEITDHQSVIAVFDDIVVTNQNVTRTK